MKKLRIYVDTSVFGGCFDEEFAKDSNEFIRTTIRRRDVILLTELIKLEIEDAPPVVRNLYRSLSPTIIENVNLTKEVLELRDQYIKAKIVGLKAITDATHIAAATVFKADVLVSWNFKHIVNYDKIRKYNAVNLMNGYQLLEIRTPKEMIYYEKE